MVRLKRALLAAFALALFGASIANAAVGINPNEPAYPTMHICNKPDIKGIELFNIRGTFGADYFWSDWACSWAGGDQSNLVVNEPITFTKNNITFGNNFGTDSNLKSLTWDFDSDGQPDLIDKGPWPMWSGYGNLMGEQFSATHSYSTPGLKSITLKVEYLSGSIEVLDGAVVVYQDKPSGEVGISINSGDEFTNRKNVTLDVVWPRYSTTMLISNDGGFRPMNTTTIPVQQKVNWTLQSSTANFSQRSVYVKFEGPSGQLGSVVSDTIQVDLVRPVIEQASLKAGNGVNSLRLGSGSLRSSLKMTVSVNDRESGPAKLLISTSASHQNAKLVGYKKSLLLSVPRGIKSVYIVAIDAAGNESDWRKVLVQ